ncbi:MAG: hypothetical protein LBU65_08445 [Planctomycetaceae bacterium]|jgi:hypothetical protein|nr:hypothetical protein [Planctomycetaceae bacterium]
MLTYQFETTISEDGSIPLVLPADLRGLSVTLKISAETGKELSTPKNQGILALQGILKGHTREELDQNKEEYLTQKYGL